MNLWQKLSIDWPCALGDWLWANIAVPLSSLPRQLTFRRIVFLAALLLATWALLQLFTIDMAFMMAGDVAFYCEIASAVMLIAVRGHISHAARMARTVLQSAARRAVAWQRQKFGARRRRSIRLPAHRDVDADDDGAFGGLAAFA